MVVTEAAATAGNEMSVSNMVLGFYEEAETERWPEDATAATTAGDGSDDDDEGSSPSPSGRRAQSAAFWREQRALLHVSSKFVHSCRICVHHAPRISV